MHNISVSSIALIVVMAMNWSNASSNELRSPEPSPRAASGKVPPQADDMKVVEDLDIQYQQAVKNNDVATMDRILADDFVLVTSKGDVHTKADLLKESGNGTVKYEHQEDSKRTVRIWGDTAVVTALLWEKGTEKGQSFDYKLWFSDVYVRTSGGWKYVFGQASVRLPAE